MAFDIAKLDVVGAANKGAEVEIVHPVSGEALGIKITVAGADSDVYRKAQRKVLTRRLNDRKAKTTAESVEAEAIELLAQSTMGWEGLQEDGRDVEFSVENARSLYKDFPWVREQIDAAIADRSLFLGN